MLSTRGGIGKSMLAASLGGLLADMGPRVLLIDANIQPSLSKYHPPRSPSPPQRPHLRHRPRGHHPGMHLAHRDRRPGHHPQRCSGGHSPAQARHPRRRHVPSLPCPCLPHHVRRQP
ncbi:hypothetical protein [Cupriavidus sp.]|uniref:nucleotide-binding protein n=1 Tax=Cupriavidus sp. TaxID=1873897 RepID=UPI003D0AA922